VENPVLSVLGQVLPLAVGVALSPLPVIAVVLVAMSPRARASGPAFVAGRMLGLAAVLAIIIAAADLLYSIANAAQLPAVVKLVLGVALLVLGITKWRPKPKGAEPALPGWMETFTTIAPGRAFGMAALMSAINPKEVALLLAVGLTIGGSQLTVPQEALVGVGVVVVASLTVAVPVIAVLAAPKRVGPVLDRLREWLTANSSIVMGILLVVIGAVVAGGAISEL
jgi:threonine/homoserine/homoserine lactone efflux protein